MNRHSQLAALLLGLACACGPSKKPLRSATTQTPRLVVLLVIDQWPLWSFERDNSHFKGGLRKLVDEGHLFVGEYPYANTFTAPGHAALATGTAPKQSGILANTWFSRQEDRHVGAVDDPTYPVFSVVASSTKPKQGVSAIRLKNPGVAEALAKAYGRDARSVAIGLKERASALMLGQQPTLAVWYDPDQPAMTTSSYFARDLPQWLISLHEKSPVSSRFQDEWLPLDPELLARVTQLPDAAPGEGVSKGLDNQFPHTIADHKPATTLRATPTGTDLVFDTAKAAVISMQLGNGKRPDLLGVTISSHDYAGHFWGQESWERLDLLLRLDQSLGDFLAFLDAQVGPDKYAILVTSDHGVEPMVEQSRAHGHDALRLSSDELIEAAERMAARTLGRGRWVHSASANSIYMTKRFRRLPAEKRRAALEKIREAVLEVPGVGFAAIAADLSSDCDSLEGDARLGCNSIDPDRSGDIYCSPKRYSIFAGEYMTGTTHGTPSPEDRFVPILAWGPDVTPGATESPVSMLRVAATLSYWLGIAPPEKSVPRPIPVSAAL